MVSAKKALISVLFFRNSLLLTLSWIIISCKWKVHLRSVFVWSCHISSLNCPQSSSPLHYTPPPSPPPLQPQSIILVSPLIIHLRSSLPPKRLQTNWSECKYDFCYIFYHFLRWLNSNPDIWFLNHISNLRPCVWNGNSQKMSHQSSFIVTKSDFMRFLKPQRKKASSCFLKASAALICP